LSFAPLVSPKLVPPWNMYRLTDAPAASSASSSAAASAAGVVWWWAPQWSNQPFQNSLHISGPVGWWARSTASRASAPEPNDAVRCRPSRLPASSISGDGWSTVVSGTVMPASRVCSASAFRYRLSSPNAPYSFSIWTSSTGPPRSIWCGTTTS
jgi:hypothetical protein